MDTQRQRQHDKQSWFREIVHLAVSQEEAHKKEVEACAGHFQHPDHFRDVLTQSSEENKVSPQRGAAKITEIDERDRGTPDDWIPRHPALIRLTGVHPFNAEPPTELLLEQGLITPNSLHYVRNHGAVPKLKWETHKLKISGLVDNPREFTMDELASLPAINIAVSISCDGNRRKEVNAIQKTRGFNWGSGGTGCAYWKGVRLRDLLEKCGVKSRDAGARFVTFESAGEELHLGHYGTSVDIIAAMNPESDFIVAYEMNNERLPPDHGFPIRMVLPGYVGGRMVKWLGEISVSDKESLNHYHWHDNKVLPAVIDKPEAFEQGWWYNPEFTLYELNITSSIVRPRHGERIKVNDMHDTYTLTGYAHAGGGRKVTIVEVSFDEGKTWKLCKRLFPEGAGRWMHRYWTWCHWSLTVEMWELLAAKSVVVRATDSGLNRQPEKITWNLLGMMNNAWFKLRVQVDLARLDEPVLHFTAPVQPGRLPGGWMIDERPTVTLRQNTNCEGKAITPEELAKHNTRESCWVSMEGRVFDLTSLLRSHPGGANSILAHAGKDATLTFFEAHAADVYQWREGFCIGYLTCWHPADTLNEMIWACPPVHQFQQVSSQTNTVLQARDWVTLKLKDKKKEGTDSYRFIFEHPNSAKGKIFGLPVGQFVYMRGEPEGRIVLRPYTPVHPILSKDEDGTVHFLIKVYRPDSAHDEGGAMSLYLDSLKPGAEVKVFGPAGRLRYEGCGVFSIHGQNLGIKRVSMVAGGTGITPIYQVLYAALSDEGDTTEMSLVYANHSEDDILLKKELDELAAMHKRFKLWYIVSEKPRAEWHYGRGRVDLKALKEHLFPSADDSLALACGPDSMMEKAALPALHELGFMGNNLVEF